MVQQYKQQTYLASEIALRDVNLQALMKHLNQTNRLTADRRVEDNTNREGVFRRYYEFQCRCSRRGVMCFILATQNHFDNCRFRRLR